MTPRELFQKAELLLEESKTALLCTDGPSGFPEVRWMTPTFLPAVPGVLYCLTDKASPKTLSLDKCPNATWLIQHTTLREIVSFQAKTHLVENPSLRATVQEALGKRLGTFWKLHSPETELVVIESILLSGEWLAPGKGLRERVMLREEGKHVE